METLKSYLPLVFVGLIAFVLQVVFLFADCGETPPRVAVKLTKAYYALDPAMADFICDQSLNVDGTNVVDAYIRKMTQAGEQLKGMNIRFKKILCGKSRSFSTPEVELPTQSLMVAGLPLEDSITLQQQGLGPHRQQGFGLFVPHKPL